MRDVCMYVCMMTMSYNKYIGQGHNRLNTISTGCVPVLNYYMINIGT